MKKNIKESNNKEFFNEILSYIMATFCILPKDIVKESEKYINGGISEPYISSWKTRNPPNEEYFYAIKKIILDILNEKGIQLYFTKSKKDIKNDLKIIFSKYNLSHVFELIQSSTDDTIEIIMHVLDAAYQNKHKIIEHKNIEEICSVYVDVQSETIETIKYTHGEDQYYLIDNYLYYHNKYGLHCICANNQTICSRVFSNEEYIAEDPNRAIAFEKHRAVENEYFSLEEQTQRNLVTNLFLYCTEENWSFEKILDMINILNLKKSVIADIVDEFTAED